MLKRGISYVEAKLKKDGEWASHKVFCITHFKEILKVEKKLVEMYMMKIMGVYSKCLLLHLLLLLFYQYFYNIAYAI